MKLLDRQNASVIAPEPVLITPELEPFVEPLDFLIVLGCGIDRYGNLEEAAIQRAEAAARLVRLGLVRQVIFSGGHSVRQEHERKKYGTHFPAEANAMVSHAIRYLGDDLPYEGVFTAENNSLSTVENLVRSRVLMEKYGLGPNSVVGIMSDERHFSAGRIQKLGSLVLPGLQKRVLRLPNAEHLTEADRQKEKVSAFFSRLYLAGVPYGNTNAIMRRRHAVEHLNEARINVQEATIEVLGRAANVWGWINPRNL